MQKHKMAVAIYREMTPEKRLEYIAENKKKHQEMCLARLTAQEKHRETLKLGREFVTKNNALMFHGEIAKYTITAGAMLKTQTEGERTQIVYCVAYSICSPKDQPSKKSAKGYIGERLREGHPYVFHIQLAQSGAIIPERLAQLIRLHIELDIVSKRVQVPAKIQREVLRGNGKSTLSPEKSIKKTSEKRLRSATKVRPQC